MTASLAHQLRADPLVSGTAVFATALTGHEDCADTCPWVQAVARAAWDDPRLPGYDLNGCVAKRRD